MNFLVEALAKYILFFRQKPSCAMYLFFEKAYMCLFSQVNYMLKPFMCLFFDKSFHVLCVYFFEKKVFMCLIGYVLIKNECTFIRVIPNTLRKSRKYDFAIHFIKLQNYNAPMYGDCNKLAYPNQLLSECRTELVNAFS